MNLGQTFVAEEYVKRVSLLFFTKQGVRSSSIWLSGWWSLRGHLVRYRASDSLLQNWAKWSCSVLANGGNFNNSLFWVIVTMDAIIPSKQPRRLQVDVCINVGTIVYYTTSCHSTKVAATTRRTTTMLRPLTKTMMMKMAIASCNAPFVLTDLYYDSYDQK